MTRGRERRRVTPRCDDGRVRIFDTTLRDGEQARAVPCRSRRSSRSRISSRDSRSTSSRRDFRRRRTATGRPCTRSRARSEESTVPTSADWRAPTSATSSAAGPRSQPAANARIHIFLATSDLHMKHKLGMTRAQVVHSGGDIGVLRLLARRAGGVLAGGRGADPNRSFCTRFSTAALQSGATTLNVPDTVGYSTPDEYGALVAGVRANVPGHRERNDLGALPRRSRPRRREFACWLRARARDRRSVPSTESVNARGTRRWRKFVMALHTRGQFFGLDTNIETRELAKHRAWSQSARASTCRRTRRSSARTPSRTRRGFTRTAC